MIVDSHLNVAFLADFEFAHLPDTTGVLPHVGGPIIPACCPTAIIAGMPAARIGDMCICTGPTDVIAMGSTNVLIGGSPAARIGDMKAHRGVIVSGSDGYYRRVNDIVPLSC